MAINETLISEGLNTFYDNITEFLKERPIEDQRFFRGCNARDLKFGVKDFDPSSVQLKFTPSSLHIKISRLNAWLTGRIDSSFLIIPFHNNAEIEIKISYIELNVRIGTQYKKGKWIPSISFIGPINYDFTYSVDVDGFAGGLIANIGGSKAYDKIQEFMREDVKNLLKDFIDNMDMEVAIDEEEGYYLDYSLVGPDGIRMKNGFIEVNSYARLYNKNYEKFNANKVSLTPVPIITKMEKDFQLYVSEFSLEFALKTYFKTNKISKMLFNNVLSEQILLAVFPEIKEKYGNKKLDIQIQPFENPFVRISEQSMTIQDNAQLTVLVEKQKIIWCSIGIILSFELNISQGVIFSKIHETTGKILTNYLPNPTVDVAHFDTLFRNLKDMILPIINSLIEKKNKFPLTNFKGINLTNINFEHKDKFLVINYNVERTSFLSIKLKRMCALYSTGLFRLLKGGFRKKYCENLKNKNKN